METLYVVQVLMHFNSEKRVFAAPKINQKRFLNSVEITFW